MRRLKKQINELDRKLGYSSSHYWFLIFLSLLYHFNFDCFEASPSIGCPCPPDCIRPRRCSSGSSVRSALPFRWRLQCCRSHHLLSKWWKEYVFGGEMMILLGYADLAVQINREPLDGGRWNQCYLFLWFFVERQRFVAACGMGDCGSRQHVKCLYQSQ